jgi:glycosyltransferase involved in cell wall biosynthesis
MKPYLLVSGDFVRTGGMDQANLALARYLADQGREVHLVTHRAEQELAGRPNVTVHRVPKVGGSRFLSGPVVDHVGGYWAAKIARRAGHVLVNGGNCRWGDANWVHYVHAAYTPYVAGSPLSQLKTRIAHRHAVAAERDCLARARVIFCNSQRTRWDVIHRLGVPEARVHAVYYGADPERFACITPAETKQARAMLGWDKNRPVVAFVGALADRRKGFDTLFAAWQMVCRDPQWDCELAVIGMGTELPTWKRRAGEAGLAGRVKFLGFRQDVPALLAACDALVHPARYEAYGLSVQEALCRGLPALVSAAAGVAERYPAELRGLLIPDPDDAADLACRLQTWRRDRERIRAQVARLSDSLRSHTWDQMAAQIVHLTESKSEIRNPKSENDERVRISDFGFRIVRHVGRVES